MHLRQNNHLARAMLAFVASSTFAHDSKTIPLVGPYPPGGATDAIARMVAPKLAQEFGQTAIGVNRTAL